MQQPQPPIPERAVEGGRPDLIAELSLVNSLTVPAPVQPPVQPRVQPQPQPNPQRTKFLGGEWSSRLEVVVEDPYGEQRSDSSDEERLLGEEPREGRQPNRLVDEPQGEWWEEPRGGRQLNRLVDEPQGEWWEEPQGGQQPNRLVEEPHGGRWSDCLVEERPLVEEFRGERRANRPVEEPRGERRANRLVEEPRGEQRANRLVVEPRGGQQPNPPKEKSRSRKWWHKPRSD